MNPPPTAHPPPPSTGRQLLIGLGCVLLLLILGWLDYRTGYEMGFFIFYSVPVGLAAWHLGRWPGVGIAFAASLTWWQADRLAGDKYSSAFYAGWNTAMHFGCFLINAITIAKIKADLDQRHQLAADLAGEREKVRVLSESLPACPACGKPKAAAPLPPTPPALPTPPTAREIPEALCTECRPLTGMRVESGELRAES